jgi:adenine-specific DNA-methyltransferase
VIKYLGSKRALLDRIVHAVRGRLPDGGRVCDLFSGSARVGHALKREGFAVHSNDHNAYAHVLATAYVQADRDRWLGPAERALSELAAVKPEPGWFTRTFCEDARFFHPENGARIDAIRERIAQWRWSRSWRPSRWCPSWSRPTGWTAPPGCTWPT